MSKPFSEDDLAAQLTQDLTCRLREISDLKAAVRSADDIARAALLRATLAICYAHWEGHIRFAARKYLTHIALRKLIFSALVPQFLRNDFLPRLAVIGQKSFKEKGEIIDLIIASSSSRFSRVNENLSHTRSNLNYEILMNICLFCVVKPSVFDDHKVFIDVILLKRRNAIAHGRNTFIDTTEFDDLTDNTINLMRLFSSELQANAYLRAYRAALV